MEKTLNLIHAKNIQQNSQTQQNLVLYLYYILFYDHIGKSLHVLEITYYIILYILLWGLLSKMLYSICGIHINICMSYLHLVSLKCIYVLLVVTIAVLGKYSWRHPIIHYKSIYAYMRTNTRQLLVEIIVCRMFGQGIISNSVRLLLDKHLETNELWLIDRDLLNQHWEFELKWEELTIGVDQVRKLRQSLILKWKQKLFKGTAATRYGMFNGMSTFVCCLLIAKYGSL